MSAEDLSGAEEDCGCGPTAQEKRALWPTMTRRVALGAGALGVVAGGAARHDLAAALARQSLDGLHDGRGIDDEELRRPRHDRLHGRGHSPYADEDRRVGLVVTVRTRTTTPAP